MKISKILAVTVIAGAVLLSGTACSGSDMGKKSEENVSTTAKPSETPAVSDKQAIANVVSGYYGYVFNTDNLISIKKAGEILKGNPKPTDEDLKVLVTNLPEGFKYFDTSSSTLIKNAYDQLYMTADMNTDKMEIVVPEEAITVKGDTATVNQAKFSVTINGGKIDNSHTTAELMKLKKTGIGSWVIVAAPSTVKG